MHVSRLQLRSFRSYRRLDLDLTVGCTLLTGANGAGKTNLLEGLATALLGRSPRTSSDANCVTSGEAGFRAQAEVWTDAGSTTMTVVYDGRRRLSIDGEPAASLGAYEHLSPVVSFLPERVLSVRGAPARRRTMLDRLVGRVEPTSTADAARYASAVAQRNAIVRRVRTGSARSIHELSPWDTLMEEHGSRVRVARAKTVTEINPHFARRFEALTGLTGAAIRIAERGGLDLGAALQESLDADVRRGSTSVGPHLDEVSLVAGERDLRTFGSTGEQRAAMLAWTFAEFDLMTERGGVDPVAVFDEPFAELDADRRDRLATSLTALPQAVVTATERPSVRMDAIEMTVGRAGVTRR